MQRLIIHLKKVDKVEAKAPKGTTKKKVFNTVNYIVSSATQISERLFQHKGNIHSYRFSSCKV